MTASQVIVLAIPVFLLMMLGEFAWSRHRGIVTYRFSDAVNSLSLGGQSDWRVPNAKELQSIVDYSRAPDYSANQGPAINSIFTTSSCGPVSASSPARCVAMLVQELLLTMRFATTCANSSGIAP